MGNQIPSSPCFQEHVETTWSCSPGKDATGCTRIFTYEVDDTLDSDTASIEHTQQQQHQQQHHNHNQNHQQQQHQKQQQQLNKISPSRAAPTTSYNTNQSSSSMKRSFRPSSDRSNPIVLTAAGGAGDGLPALTDKLSSSTTSCSDPDSTAAAVASVTAVNEEDDVVENDGNVPASQTWSFGSSRSNLFRSFASGSVDRDARVDLGTSRGGSSTGGREDYDQDTARTGVYSDEGLNASRE